ncbi:hypothetical protein SDC9_112012 [bioreactor metagenome]|uniref:Uncharacterized protein n=1 Tax=bioreactor metagenome TaxID=1076179 RepID=A0A645BI23_9ZZZZ
MTRNTFQPGRVSPSGRATALKLCAVPSQLTKVPEVAEKGAIGSSTSAVSRSDSASKADSAITNWALPNAATAATPSAKSSAGSAPSNT